MNVKEMIKGWYDRCYALQRPFRFGLVDQTDATEIRSFLKDFKPGSLVLDAGCGTGRLLVACAEAGMRAVAIDLSPVALAESRRRFAESSWSPDLLSADVEWLPFRDGSFDACFLYGTLEYVSHPEPVFWEIRRTLREGGRVLATMSNRAGLLYKISRSRLLQWAFRLCSWGPRTSIADVVCAQDPTEVREALELVGFAPTRLRGHQLTRNFASLLEHIRLRERSRLVTVFRRLGESIERSAMGTSVCPGFIIEGERPYVHRSRLTGNSREVRDGDHGPLQLRHRGRETERLETILRAANVAYRTCFVVAAVSTAILVPYEIVVGRQYDSPLQAAFFSSFALGLVLLAVTTIAQASRGSKQKESKVHRDRGDPKEN